MGRGYYVYKVDAHAIIHRISRYNLNNGDSLKTSLCLECLGG